MNLLDRPYLLFILIIFPLTALTVTFESLSVEKAVKLAIVAERPQLANFYLQFSSAGNAEFYIKIEYIIDKDTLTDYRYINTKFEGIIKEINLNKATVVTANLYLHTMGINKLDSIIGEFKYKLSPIRESDDQEGERKFTGSIWGANEQVLFKINKQVEDGHKLMLTLTTNENFNYDKLFLKIKAVSPTDGILLIDKTLDINKDDCLDFNGRSLSITLDKFKMSKEGNYYIQISHQMANEYLNGIESIAYEIIDI
jgi:gliding motility-associated lipoprotein GldH